MFEFFFLNWHFLAFIIIIEFHHHIKGKCYGSDPVVISLQLTNFQTLIGLRMNHIVFRDDPKQNIELKCHDTCLS